MTELEAFQALRIEAAFALSIGEQSITIFTGYLLIAFFIGSKLTFFQVSFVSLVFSMMYISSSISIVSAMPTLNHFAERLIATGSEIPMTTVVASPEMATITVLLMFVGALYFMWTVRHPKTE